MPPNISQQIGATLFVKLDLTPFYKQVNSIYLNHSETPTDLNQIEAILAPGLAFDPTGVRLGRGGGFYDRIFSTYLGIRIGICKQSRILTNLPSDEWDQKVHWLCDEKDGMKECRGK